MMNGKEYEVSSTNKGSNYPLFLSEWQFPNDLLWNKQRVRSFSEHIKKIKIKTHLKNKDLPNSTEKKLTKP